ncbi:hypothetical protein TRM7557_01749 [Tritonibacter multivorans]|uniref:Uncharacterized protein n=1 Tax=Tritonibacter multivorans TaxID=928856 RepID=A0A0P1G9X7_9RHOB|nr:hypothetical protein TRM7557_01749 [Tritonibacter multivorans]
MIGDIGGGIGEPDRDVTANGQRIAGGDGQIGALVTVQRDIGGHGQAGGVKDHSAEGRKAGAKGDLIRGNGQHAAARIDRAIAGPGAAGLGQGKAAISAVGDVTRLGDRAGDGDIGPKIRGAGEGQVAGHIRVQMERGSCGDIHICGGCSIDGEGSARDVKPAGDRAGAIHGGGACGLADCAGDIAREGQRAAVAQGLIAQNVRVDIQRARIGEPRAQGQLMINVKAAAGDLHQSRDRATAGGDSRARRGDGAGDAVFQIERRPCGDVDICGGCGADGEGSALDVKPARDRAGAIHGGGACGLADCAGDIAREGQRAVVAQGLIA